MGIDLTGPWLGGWALDLHSEKSVPIGSGIFDTTRTKFGEALYQLKYHQDKTQIPFLVKWALRCLNGKQSTPYLLAVLPVPPSNLARQFQPVYLLAEEVAKGLGIKFDTSLIRKTRRTKEQKNATCQKDRAKELKGAFAINDQRYSGKYILLIDDLYSSGSTMEEICKALYNDGGIKGVIVFAFTKTRSGGKNG